MYWWSWIVLGLLLMVVELAMVDAAFYLVFLGAAAVIMGVLVLGSPDLPVWGQFLMFAVLALGSMVLFRQKLYAKLRGNIPGYRNFNAEQVVKVEEDVPVGGKTRIRLRGTQWTAINRGSETIAAGSNARIRKAEGVELYIEGLPAERPAND